MISYNIIDQIFIANASYLGSYGNAANYHIALDSDVIGIEKCAEIMEGLV